MPCSRAKSILLGALKDTTAVAWFVFPFVIVIALWISAYPLMMKWHNNDIVKAGQVGDMFGMYNTLFTGLALVGLIYTIKLQRDELKEAKLDADEQRKHIAHQQFESTFFQLLRILEKVVDSVERFRSHENTHGRIAIVNICLQLTEECQKLPQDKKLSFISQYYAGLDPQLGHYFRVFYRVMRLIEQSEPLQFDVSFYAKTLRAQLSVQELILIGYNGTTPNGDRMRRLVEKYGIFKHLGEQGGVKKELEMYYSPEAFKDSDE